MPLTEDGSDPRIRYRANLPLNLLPDGFADSSGEDYVSFNRPDLCKEGVSLFRIRSIVRHTIPRTPQLFCTLAAGFFYYLRSPNAKLRDYALGAYGE